MAPVGSKSSCKTPNMASSTFKGDTGYNKVSFNDHILFCLLLTPSTSCCLGRSDAASSTARVIPHTVLQVGRRSNRVPIYKYGFRITFL
jgi:hypothetical protein